MELLVHFFWIILLLCFLSQLEAQSIPVGGAYIGCGYDVLIGNPDGASFKNGGLDPGLKPAKFVLMKTFGAESGYCPTEATCVEVGGTFAEETYSLNADLEQYRQDYSSLWSSESDGSLLIASFGGTISHSYQEAKDMITDQQKVILNKHRVTITGNAVYNTRRNRRLNPELLDSLCELPMNYSQEAYIQWIQEWGTHVIISAVLGVRESVREDYSKKVIINALQRNQSFVVQQKAGFLTVLSSALTGSVSNDLVNELQHVNVYLSRWTSAIGSPIAPAPLSLELRSVDKFITADSILNDSQISCQSLKNADNIRTLHGNLAQALKDYPAFLGAQLPQPIIRESPLNWPTGSYSLLMSNDGCPEGPWANGSRYEDTNDRFPNNYWSPGFQFTTAMSLWHNNLMWRFCSKILDFDSDSMDWPQGAYCVFKKGDCPRGFDTGSLYLDDEIFFNANDYTGTLPDGEYNRKTRYYFCCRDDGAVNKAIFLPKAKPFLLLPIGPACQIVAGMDHVLHFLRVDTMWNGWSTMTGKHPYGTAESTLKWTIYFCYYQMSNSTYSNSTV